MPSIELPWASKTYSGRTRVASLERLVNLFPEININQRDATFVLISAPGSRLLTDMPDGSDVVQIASVAGKLFAWSRKGLYVIKDCEPRLIYEHKFGKRITWDSGITYDDSGVKRHKLFFTANGNGYVADVIDESVNQITDDSFLDATSTAYLDGYAIWSRMGSDQFFWSSISGYEAYNGLDFASAEGRGDNIVRLLSFERELWVFGEKSTEIWQNTGDSNAPFIRMGNAFIEVGCANGDTVVKLTRDLYWVGDDLRVYRTAAKSYRPDPISMHQDVEHDLYRYGAQGAYAFGVTMEGHAFYWLTIPRANRTWVYDETTEAWHERSTFDRALDCDDCENQVYGVHLANCGEMMDGVAYVGGKGAVYTLDLDYFRDGEERIMREATTGPVSLNENEITYKRIRMRVQNDCCFRDSDCCPEEDDLILEWSKDQGKTWRGGERKRIAHDDPDYLPTWVLLGRGTNRAWRWRTFADYPLVFKSAIFDIQEANRGRA